MERLTNYDYEKTLTAIEGCKTLLNEWVRQQPAVYHDMESIRKFDGVDKALDELYEHISNQI